MRSFQSSALLSFGFVLCALGSPVPPGTKENNVIKSAADIPIEFTSNGFSYKIVDRLGKDDTRDKEAQSPASPLLQKRVDFLHCLGPGVSHPLQDDCTTLIGQISAYPGTIITPAGYCHEAEFRTCLAFYCDTTCDEQQVSTERWANLLNTVNVGCVSDGQNGIITDGTDDAGTGATYQAGLEHSGTELPSYPNGTC